jgi:hypothetical protein
MASYACPNCGTISDAQPCITCGGPAFNLDDTTEREELRFTLSRQRRMRAGVPALIGAGVGIALAVVLGARYLVIEPLPYLCAIAFVAIAGLRESPARAALDAELAARTGRAANRARLNGTLLAVAVLLIAVRIGVSVHGQTSTMPRSDARQMVSTRMCEIAKRCNSKAPLLCDISGQISVMLTRPSSRVDRDTVDDCLDALRELESHHEVCAAPSPASCAEITSESVPAILQQGRKLENDIDRDLERQLQRH